MANMDELEEMKKLKVPELKQALKDKGLSTAGTKPELIKRLMESEKSLETSDPVLDEDEILKDDPPPIIEISTTSSPDTIEAPKETKNTSNNNSNSTEADSKIQMPADTTALAKPNEVSKLTEAERLKLRAEKFGAASEQAKKTLRAERFGLALTENKSGNISSTIPPVDVEKLKKRAERFGVSTSSVTEDDKKRKRAERFGTSLTASVSTCVTLNSLDSELEAKKRKRAERFGLT